MQKVIEILEGINSTYVPSFLTLCEQVSVAMTEANDNVKFLETLVAHLLAEREEGRHVGRVDPL